MRQRDLRARLLEEQPQEAPIVADARQDALDDQPLLEALRADVARQEHLGHAAAAERAEELVATEAHCHERDDTICARARPRVLPRCSLRLAAPSRAAATGGTVAVYWQPPGEPAPAARGAGGIRRGGGAPRGAHRSSTPSSRRAGEPLAGAGARRGASPTTPRFRFAEALAKLDELARLADARGGGDLDPRQLSEIYLYRGLARLELGPAEAAWDDLVRAARLDPTRVIDPARFPPRVVAAYRRAVAEVAQLPRAELEVTRPTARVVRFDGRVLARRRSPSRSGRTSSPSPPTATSRGPAWSRSTAAHERLRRRCAGTSRPTPIGCWRSPRDRAPARILARRRRARRRRLALRRARAHARRRQRSSSGSGAARRRAGRDRRRARGGAADAGRGRTVGRRAGRSTVAGGCGPSPAAWRRRWRSSSRSASSTPAPRRPASVGGPIGPLR